MGYFTQAAASDRALPGLNLTTFLAGIVRVTPVAGLRPSRLARSVTEKVPTPLTEHRCRLLWFLE